jgi:3-hydroxybutyryl-CoA dehydratase
MNIKLKEKNFKTPIHIKKLKIGLKRQYTLKITSKLHNQFKKFSGDNSPIHNDLNFCKINRYKKKLGYAFLLTAALSKIYGVYFPGGNELCVHQSCNFRKPYFINDNLLFTLKVIQLNKESKIITLNIDITCKNKIIFNGQSILKLSLKR